MPSIPAFENESNSITICHCRRIHILAINVEAQPTSISIARIGPPINTKYIMGKHFRSWGQPCRTTNSLDCRPEWRTLLRVSVKSPFIVSMVQSFEGPNPLKRKGRCSTKSFFLTVYSNSMHSTWFPLITS